MQKEEGKVRIDGSDPVGHDEPGPVSSGPGVLIYGSHPSAVIWRKMEKISAGCCP